MVCRRLAAAVLWQGLWRCGAPSATVAELQAKLCWRTEYLSREDCCNTKLYGRYGNQICWTHGFSYARCCSDDPEAASYLQWVRDSLTYHLVVKSDVASAVKRKDFRIDLDSAFVDWAKSDSKLVTSGPAATVATLIRLLDAGPGPELSVTDAFGAFLDVDRPLFAHLQSGLPVFALFAILMHRTLQAAAKGVPRPSADNVTEPSAAMGRCFRGCAGSPVQAGECVKACVAGAVALPLSHSFKGLCRRRSATEPLRTSLLEEAERAMAHLQHSRAFRRPEVWVELHRLQSKVHFRASCPDGAIKYTTDSEPPYDVCLPVPGVALRGGSSPNAMDYHMFQSILKHGRWKDCDLLKDAAIFAGMLPCPTCVAVDVGSALGACTSFLVAMGFTVHALDPVLWNVALARAALWEAECSGKLVVHHAAASDAERLRDGAARSGQAWAAVGEEPVQTVRLDDLLNRTSGHILMKIDVEGEELQVLRGALGLFERKRVHAVMLEVHCFMLRQAGVHPWEPPQLLVEYGFTIEVHYPPNFGFVDKEGFESAERYLAKEHEAPNVQVLAILPPTLW